MTLANNFKSHSLLHVKITIMKTQRIPPYFFAILLIASTLSCTNNKKSENVILKEKVTLSYINPEKANDSLLKEEIIINEISWHFQTLNRDSINSDNYMTTPTLTFSIDSTYVLLNSGCNTYIGDCYFKTNQRIKFDKIKIKEEKCPIGSLERDIIYALETCNNYFIDENNLYLLYNDKIVANLTSE